MKKETRYWFSILSLKRLIQLCLLWTLLVTPSIPILCYTCSLVQIHNSPSHCIDQRKTNSQKEVKNCYKKVNEKFSTLFGKNVWQTDLMAKKFTTEVLEALNECALQEKFVSKPEYRIQKAPFY